MKNNIVASGVPVLEHIKDTYTHAQDNLSYPPSAPHDSCLYRPLHQTHFKMFVIS